MPRPSYLSRRAGVRCRVSLAGALSAVLLLLAVAGCRSGEAPGTTAGNSSARTAQTAQGEAPDSTAPQAPASDTLTVLVVGNSLAAGYGLDASQSFPALLQQKADSAGLRRVHVVNAGNSGETTAGGRRRIDWLLRRPDVDVLLLELGGNDALRGLPPDSARANLRTIIRKTKSRFPDARVVLAGMKAPPNMGSAYARRFEQVYPALAEETGATLVPFLLEGVAGRPALNQADGIHPTAAGQRILAQNVWDTLAPLLRQMHAPPG